MASELLRKVRVLDPLSESDRVADVLIEDGYIRAIANSLSEADLPEQVQVTDGQGLILGPGLVDLYSSSGEPGFEERETVKSLIEAARAGGFTRLTVLPNTHPPLDQAGHVAWLQRRWQTQQQAESPAKIRLNLWGALTLGLEGQQMTELADLVSAGVVGFTDGKTLQSPVLLRRVLEYLKPLGLPIAFWPCDRALAGNGVAREGIDSTQFGLPGIPAMAETAALAALLECVAAIGAPVHIMRVSTARSVALIRAAKERGVPVTASTTWMHVLQNTQALASYDPSLRLDPPLGTPDDQAALLNGLQTGVLDAIAIDHIPYTYEEKTVAFSEAPPGAIGLELALPLLWQALVDSGEWSALQLWRCLSTQPAQCLQQEVARLHPEQPAEMILFDPKQAWTVEAQTLNSRSTNTPWLGQTVWGRVLQTWAPEI